MKEKGRNSDPSVELLNISVLAHTSETIKSMTGHMIIYQSLAPVSSYGRSHTDTYSHHSWSPTSSPIKAGKHSLYPNRWDYLLLSSI